MSTGRIVATTHCLVFISLKLPTLLLNAVPAFFLRVCIAIALHLLALLALSIAAAGTTTSTTQAKITEYEERKGAREIVPDVQQVGFIAGCYTLALAWLSPGFHPLLEAGIRVLCFFMACKVWELGVVRAGSAPKLLLKDVEMGSWRGKIAYVFRLFTEARYASFDIRVNESRRRELYHKTSKMERICWTWIPRILVPIATYFYPIPEFQILMSLVNINSGLELLHTCLHPFCPDVLFLLPFSANGIAEFWSVHWHQGAQSWLIALGYRPVQQAVVGGLGLSKEIGKAAGVVGAFALSGIWHGWCAGALSTSPWTVGVVIFLVFVGQGVGCVVERLLWKKNEGGLLKRVVCWAFAIESGAILLRVGIPTVKSDVTWLLHPVRSLGFTTT